MLVRKNNSCNTHKMSKKRKRIIETDDKKSISKEPKNNRDQLLELFGSTTTDKEIQEISKEGY